ncbi:MAG: 16S rRNA (cytosine(1402)-N(4))-methyltransferase RsmH [Patescibacteria group bacterium]|nr:16S rRNA (cytosine(1402)-N(4))-methyltransferase RsmH [Patescibacteria group bacterium]
MIHTPVLLHEVLDTLDLHPGDLVIDGTAGAGGHAREIARRIGPQGTLLLVDWDPETVRLLEKEVRPSSRTHVVCGNYADVPEIMERLGLGRADAFLLDLGFSSDQLLRGRGFSFQESAAQEPLLMTYDDTAEPVSQMLRRMSAKELAAIITEFGEERYARKIAEAIVARRGTITTAGDLVRAIQSAVPKSYERGRIHPATRTFQALRIYANHELDNVGKVLQRLPEIMAPGGRVAVISFHSLEDRIVKDHFQLLKRQGKASMLTPKPVSAGFEEVARNPRARSAKLRALRIN